MMRLEKTSGISRVSRLFAVGVLLLVGFRGATARPAHLESDLNEPDGRRSSTLEARSIPAELSAGALPKSKQGLSARERSRVFEKVWKEIEDRYYDPSFHGVDWQEVGRRYRPLVEAAKDDDEFYDLLKRMTGELHDAHTRFSTPTEWENRKKHEGVSLGFLAEEIDSKEVVSYVRPGSDAARAGIVPGMIILTVDGRPMAERVEEAKAKRPRSSSDRADRIFLFREVFAGTLNSPVKLGLQRADGSTFEASLTRQVYPIRVGVEARVLPSGDAYIRFDGFEPGINKQFRQALERHRSAPGLIIDLRNNGGGTLGAVLPIAGYFLGKKTLFARDATRTGKPVSQFGGLFKLGPNLFAGKRGGQIYSGPVVILVKERTGSASEIFAAGMQEIGRARIVGSQSCGCVLGIIKPRGMKGGGVLEISEVLWLTPKGRRLEGAGVIPDKTVRPTISDLQHKRDPVLQEAEKELKKTVMARAPARER